MKKKLFKLYIQKNKNYKDIEQILNSILLTLDEHSYDWFVFKYYRDNVSNFDEINFTEEVYNAILLYMQGVLPSKKIHSIGNHYVYYKSKLDNQTRKLAVYVSDCYINEKSTSLFLFFSAFKPTKEIWKLNKYPRKFIAVDVYSLGFTSGSYIGEAFINEVIENITSLYNIDKLKIFASGWSNGATALWSQVLCYPHKYAAVHFVSGLPILDLLRNLNGKYVINVSSYTDLIYKKAFKSLNKKLSNVCNYNKILIANTNHEDLGDMILKKSVLDSLFENTLDIFPKKINFTTVHAYHNVAFWVKINYISYSKHKAKIKVEVIENTIYILTYNIDSFTLTIPPYICRDLFFVIINRKNFKFEKYNKEHIIFTRYQDNRGFCIAKKSDKENEIYKGLGLLYVYLNPLIIYNPNENTAHIAKIFANPTTNGENNRININYPICNSLNNNENYNCIIAIDANTDDPFLIKLRNLAPVKCKKFGYIYNKKIHNCEYCIMQIIKNPLSENGYILYINTNNISLYANNFFTRRVILPSYSSGYHPFLNNAALIFTDGKYKRIFEYGMDEELIN